MFKRRRFPAAIILFCVHWYCKYGISYRDLVEMIQELGVEVDQQQSNLSSIDEGAASLRLPLTVFTSTPDASLLTLGRPPRRP